MTHERADHGPCCSVPHPHGSITVPGSEDLAAWMICDGAARSLRGRELPRGERGEDGGAVLLGRSAKLRREPSGAQELRAQERDVADLCVGDIGAAETRKAEIGV